MIMAVVACTAAISQASAYNWKTAAAATGGTICLPGTTTALNGGTGYLFYASAAETVFDAWKGGTALASISGSLDNSPITTAGGIGAKTGDGVIDVDVAHLDAFFAVEQTIAGQKYLFISEAAGVDAKSVGAASISFKAKAASSAAAKDLNAGYNGAGWYTAVPEPTSGLLLLLGVAGIALRRRRA